MSGAVKVPGVELVFDGTAYVVPPLNAAAIKQYRQQVAELMSDGTPDIEIVCALLQAALARNYPSVTLAQVEQWVDYSNLFEVVDAVMNVSGLVAKMGEFRRRMEAATNPPASTI